MILSEKVEIITQKLQDKGIKANVTVIKKGLRRNKCLKVLVEGVTDDLATSSSIQHVLREHLGYGESNTNHDVGDKVFTLEYSPVKKRGLISSRFRSIDNDRYTPIQATPGSTDYNG